jgi:hypothetical protein
MGTATWGIDFSNLGRVFDGVWAREEAKRRTDTAIDGKPITEAVEKVLGYVGAWVCPVCGCGVAPGVSICPHCVSRLPQPNFPPKEPPSLPWRRPFPDLRPWYREPNWGPHYGIVWC